MMELQPKLKGKPVVDLLVSRALTQFASTYPTFCLASFLGNINLKSIVPLMYLKILFVASMCACCGVDVQQLTQLTGNTMLSLVLVRKIKLPTRL